MKIKKLPKLALYISLIAAFSGTAAFAANNSTLTQSIAAGVLSTDILDAARAAVASPTAALSAKTYSFDCQFGAGASSGLLGSNTERLYLSNPSAANNGWNLTIAATSGATASWANGGATRFYDFNDPTTSGCTDGADLDTRSGQLAMDPSISTLTTDCSACTITGVTKGSATAFNEGTVNAITLLSAGATSDDVWRGYLTGVDLKQSIPGETPADAYSLNLTLTATAL